MYAISYPRALRQSNVWSESTYHFTSRPTYSTCQTQQQQQSHKQVSSFSYIFINIILSSQRFRFYVVVVVVAVAFIIAIVAVDAINDINEGRGQCFCLPPPMSSSSYTFFLSFFMLACLLCVCSVLLTCKHALQVDIAFVVHNFCCYCFCFAQWMRLRA